jgi:hypothetical protein
MSEPIRVLQELLFKYEESVEAKERELESYRLETSARISLLEAEIVEHRETINSLRVRFKGKPHPTGQPGDLVRSPIVERGSQTSVIRHFVRSELNKEGGTLTRKEIRRRLEKSPLVFDSSNLPELIRAALSRDPSLIYLPRLGYKLNGRY